MCVQQVAPIRDDLLQIAVAVYQYRALLQKHADVEDGAGGKKLKECKLYGDVRFGCDLGPDKH